jgi:hypothetical protein
MRKPLNELRLNPDNYRDMSPEAFQRGKKQLIGKGQFRDILITSDGMIIGGNGRYAVCQEVSVMGIPEMQDYVMENFSHEITPEQAQKIIDNASNPKVSVIEIVDENGVFYITEDGERQPETYPTREKAILAVATSDNDTWGFYTDDFVSYADQFNIDPNDYAVNFYELPTIAESLKLEEKRKKKLWVSIECQTDTEQQEVAQKLQSQGFKVKVR